MELTLAAKERFLISAGSFNNSLIVDLIRRNFPEYSFALPLASAGEGDYPVEGATPNHRTSTIGLLLHPVQTVPFSISTQYAHNNGFGTTTSYRNRKWGEIAISPHESPRKQEDPTDVGNKFSKWS
ncbi:hypothetical protein OIDMADRAFT_58925 [Oidiodendron maius Zn]|uniref:Uncharacterized protein n=1 Tax=Oidiodendron maius (strain Zn) TaxID=913774 RepID=A0A0C3GKG5_OIDMZ|nr:hypothetical protein OIDMADRAFT_58925 [Oidiodendron maius Zn]